LRCVPTSPAPPASPDGDARGAHRSTSLFIASLDDHRAAAAAAFPLCNVTQKYHVSFEQHTASQFRTAVHDIWVLGMLDDLVLTPDSTFGYLAAAMRGVPAFYPVTRQRCIDSANSVPNQNTTKSGQSSSSSSGSSSVCFRAASFEPCFYRGLFLGDHHQRALSALVRCEDSCGEIDVEIGAGAGAVHVRRSRGWRLRTI
jgi:hypothetical protein